MPLPSAVRKYKELVAPHVESFNYFLEDGLSEAVAHSPPLEMRMSEDGESGPLLKIWVEEVKIGFATRAGNNSEAITPRLVGIR